MDVRKALLIFLGTVFVGLGVLGMFLPLVPTTIFLLLAAYCYSRSSERFHEWLLTNRWCGRYIKDYQEGKGMSAAHKVRTIFLLWGSIGFSIWLVGGRLWLSLLLAAIAIGVTAHVLWIRTARPSTVESHAEEPAQV